jgi:hypothetical protein
MEVEKVVLSTWVDRAVVQEIDLRRGSMSRSLYVRELIKDRLLPKISPVMNDVPKDSATLPNPMDTNLGLMTRPNEEVSP